jgi:hypothetical protein
MASRFDRGLAGDVARTELVPAPERALMFSLRRASQMIQKATLGSAQAGRLLLVQLGSPDLTMGALASVGGCCTKPCTKSGAPLAVTAVEGAGSGEVEQSARCLNDDLRVFLTPPLERSQ